MRFLISGGPTHEYLDDVRFLGNPSTGAMGVAIAEEAARRGHTTHLVLGPSHLPDPGQGITIHRVVSALDMKAAMEGLFPESDATIMSAAVSDYRPRVRFDGKIKKSTDELALDLVKNPDILGSLGGRPRHGVLVGFALESAPPPEALAYAQGKLRSKGCDYVVLNRTGSFGGSAAEDVLILAADGRSERLGETTKRAVACALIDACEQHAGTVDPTPPS